MIIPVAFRKGYGLKRIFTFNQQDAMEQLKRSWVKTITKDRVRDDLLMWSLDVDEQLLRLTTI